MRPVLFRILLDRPWQLWDGDVDGVFGIGAGVLMLVAATLAAAYLTRIGGWRRDGIALAITLTIGLIVVATLSSKINDSIARKSLEPVRPTQQLPDNPAPPPVSLFDSIPPSIPVYGYGFLVLTGFLAGTWVGQRRAEREGINPETVFDATFWTLVSGVFGARLFHLIQYRQHVYANVHSLGEFVMASINLSQGGLVLIGGMLGGAIGYFVVCHRRKISPMVLVDVLTPSIFIGIGFGRLGCLLYSCCYGDPTTLPWGIEFPHGSVAFDAYVQRGLVSPNAPLCIPLHPTQVYSSINGFILAAVTIAYFPYRRHPGQVFSLGMILYAITRFAIEIVRSDEEGQLGTPLTISQLLCLAMLAAGIWLAVHLSRQPRSTEKS